jgi:uncharacterized damage-inducible protein DinB
MEERRARPAEDDFAEYYGGYIGLVPDGDIVETLARQFEETRSLLASVPPDGEEYRYAEGKWSIREVVGHLLDTERVFAFRALWFARGAPDAQPGMEQDDWAAAANAGARPLADLVDEWAALRRSNVLMFGGFAAPAWSRRGRASGMELTVRAAAWIVAGHERHHLRGLRRDYGLGDG